MSENIPVDLKEVVLQKIRFGINLVENCYPQDLKYDVERDIMRNRIIHLITWNLLGKDIETRKYPSTWWNAFKNRWYPRFLKKRFPVEWDEFKLYNICPHINQVWSKDQSIHIQWLEENHGFARARDLGPDDPSFWPCAEAKDASPKKEVDVE